MRSKTCCSMAELRGLHAPLAAFVHIIDTSRLLKILKAAGLFFSIASYASQATDWLLQKGHGVDESTPEVEQPKVDDALPY